MSVPSIHHASIPTTFSLLYGHFYSFGTRGHWGLFPPKDDIDVIVMSGGDNFCQAVQTLHGIKLSSYHERAIWEDEQVNLHRVINNLSKFAGVLVPYNCTLCGLCCENPICEQCRQTLDSDTDITDRVVFAGEFPVLVRSLASYESAYGDVVRAMKYGAHRSIAVEIGRSLAQCYDNRQWSYVVPIPMHRSRLQTRPFNVAHLLAWSIARTGGPEFGPFLERRDDTASKVGFSAQERRAAQPRFVLKSGACVREQTVLLIDDVVTTGTTIASAARVLVDAGVGNIAGLAIASVS